MKFKKGDLIIYTANSKDHYNSFGVDPVVKGNIYKISHYNRHTNVCFSEFAGFGGSKDHGYFPHKCEQITYLTDKLKFKIIKQKLGVRDECQKK